MDVMRKITQLVETQTQKLVGDYPGKHADKTDDEIFEEFELRSTQMVGLSLSREIFNEKFEIVRYVELSKAFEIYQASENDTLQ